MEENEENLQEQSSRIIEQMNTNPSNIIQNQLNSNQSNNNIPNSNSNLMFHFTNGKAGMEGLDREEIDKIIYEATKDSVITKKKMEDLEKSKLIVEDYRIKLESLHKNEILLEQNRKLAETRIKELKKGRLLDRIWMHIDMDMFYAAIEIRDSPELKDKPVAVGNERMISTSNYVARKFGVRSAMPGFLAKKLCKDLIFVNCNFHKYETESKKIMKILKEYDPDIEVRGLDEAYLDLTNYCGNNYITTEQEIRDLITEIKAKILTQTQLTSSCGIACNKMLAKICSDIQKPDGLFILPNDEGTIENFMKSLKVRKIPGVGVMCEQKLNLMEIYTCEDIIKRNVDLYHLFTDNMFDFLLSAAYGISACFHEEVREAISKSISCSETFRMTSDMEFLTKTFHSLCKKLYQNMLEQSVIGRTLTIEITDQNERHSGKSQALNKKYETESELINNGYNVLRSMLESGANIRMLRVKLSSLTQVNPETLKKKEENNIKQWINKLNSGSILKSEEDELTDRKSKSAGKLQSPQIAEEKKNKTPQNNKNKSPTKGKYGKIEEMFAKVPKTMDSADKQGKNSVSNSQSLKRHSEESKGTSSSKKSSNKKNKKGKKNSSANDKHIGPLDAFFKKTSNSNNNI